MRQDCGCPPYRRLTRISRDLGTHYQPSGDVPCTLTPLSLTAISEILAGHRKGLPTFDWVASFVLSCQRWAHLNHAISRDPGTSSLPRWAALLAAHAASASPPQQVATPGSGPAGHLSPDQTAFISSHGPYGVILLSQARQGHPDALFRIALLLATDPALSGHGPAFLLAAAAAGSAPAIDMLDADPAQLDAFDAARNAHDLARAAQARGALDEAIALYRAAARGGIADAAIEHAQAILADKGDEEAASWLASLTAQPSTGRHSTSQT